MSSPHQHAQDTTDLSTPAPTTMTPNMISTASQKSSNTSSSISVTPSAASTTARKAHHPPLEAIQTQKAQASVTFRPVSSTSSEIEGDALAVTNSEVSGSGLTPYSPFPSHPSQQYQTPPGQQQHRNSVVIMTGYTDPPLHTASTGNGSFPFTPSTLVEGGSVPSPVDVGGNAYQGYQGQDGGHFQTIPLSPTRAEKTHASPSATVSPDLQHHTYSHSHSHSHQQQQRPPQLRASGSRRQQRQQQHNTYPGTGTGADAGASTNHPRPNSTGSNNTNAYYNKHNTFSTSKQQGSQGMDLTYSSSSDDPRFQHLPSLWQVLHRKTQPPVCLFNFYLYMRDDEKSSEEVDFWLDVTAHEVLWRLYVRATKRRMAMAEREQRMERERMERERAIQEELELEAYEAELAALAVAHGLEEERSAHRKQPSVTLDMYEPHWSAANRYLEMSSPEGSSIVDPANITNSTNPSSPTTPKQHHDLTRYYIDESLHSKEPTDQILMVHNALKNPTAQQGLHGGLYPVPENRVQHVRLPGAIPASWAHPTELETQYGTESGISEGTSTGALPPTPAGRATAAAKSGAELSPRTEAPSSNDAGIAMTSGHRVGTNGTSTSKTTTTTGKTSQGAGTGAGAGTAATPRRAMTSGSGGVTKEDLQRSAERIYYKYLIPQAEKRVRIPGAVRQRVAQLMDSKMMNTPSVGNQSPVVASTGFEGQPKGARPSSPALKRKNNLGSPTPSQHGALSTSQLDLSLNEKSRGSSVSEPAPLRLPSPTSKKEKHLKHQNSSTSLRQQQQLAMAGPNSGLQQPDQDLGLVFAEAREIVFEGMESYYFPRFLKARAYGNMVPSHRLLRVVLGLFFLFVGFAVVLTLIFLNIRPRSLRAWALIPIFLGAFLCTTFQFNICPVMVAFGISETKWMQFAKVKEPYLLKLHRRRGIKVVVVAVLYTVCVGIVFGLVPGHRL